MSYHNSRLNAPLGCQVVGLNQIVIVAAGGAHDVLAGVVYLVEIYLSLELAVSRAGKEVHAAVKGKDFVAQLCHLAYRHVHKYIVIALATGNIHQPLHRVIHSGSIHIKQLNAPLGSHGLRNNLPGTGNLVIINISYHNALRLIFFQLEAVADSTQPHRAAATQDNDVAACLGINLQVVVSLVGVVVAMIAADNAAHRLTQGCLEEAFALVFHQAAQLHYLMRDNAVGAGTAEELIGIARGGQAALVVQGRLLGKLHARLELVLPLLANLYDDTGKFMADNDRVGVDVLRGTLVVLALFHQLVGGHADAVAHDFYEDFVILDGRELKLLKTQIPGTIHSYCFCFHADFSFIMLQLSCYNKLSYFLYAENWCWQLTAKACIPYLHPRWQAGRQQLRPSSCQQ